MLVQARPEWPQLHLVSVLEDPPLAAEVVTADRAELILKTGGRLTIDRASGIASYAIPRQLTDEELIHPFLGPAAALVAFWLGRLSFHAGAFVSDGGVWGLVGDREAGKSSALAWFARTGHDVVADDLLMLGDGIAYAGPRSIDLRGDAAEHLGVGRALGVVGTRPRWRVVLPQMSGELPFRGWIFLGWGERIDARRLSGSECLARLIKALTVRLTAPDPAALLALTSLPAWEVRRPRDWKRLGETSERLLSVAR